MIADILTKPLQGELFRRLRRKLLNWRDESSSPQGVCLGKAVMGKVVTPEIALDVDLEMS